MKIVMEPFVRSVEDQERHFTSENRRNMGYTSVYKLEESC